LPRVAQLRTPPPSRRKKERRATPASRGRIREIKGLSSPVYGGGGGEADGGGVGRDPILASIGP